MTWARRRSRQCNDPSHGLLDGFESGVHPLADPVALNQLGTLLRDTYLAPLATAADRPLEQAEGRLRFASSCFACLFDGGAQPDDLAAHLSDFVNLERTAANAVALLFAGSNQGGAGGQGLTYANPIHAVLEKLKIELAL